MTEVTIAATQMSCSENITENVDKAETFIRQAADKGAQIILLQELFMSPYFCKDINHEYFEYAKEADNHPELKKMAALAKELSVVLPVSFFEKANQAYFNSVMVIDANGIFLGKYRKTHIPDAPGYYEKYYFNPGDTGARVWHTRVVMRRSTGMPNLSESSNPATHSSSASLYCPRACRIVPRLLWACAFPGFSRSTCRKCSAAS